MRRALAASAVLAALVAAPARADTQDTIRVVQEGVQAALGDLIEPRYGPECAELNLGLAGAAGGRETEEQALIRSLPDRGNGLRPGATGDDAGKLPARVYFKTAGESFNRRYYFATQGGDLYFKSNAERTGIEQPWKRLSLPPCFDHDVREIALDDDELIAVDSQRRVFTLDGALGDPLLFNWTSRWGAPFWQGGGWRLPRDIQAWGWSVLSLPEDRVYVDPAGHPWPVGEAKVSHIWQLSHGGRRLTFNDPWLPRDSNYEMCGPRRGRFRAENIAVSGSTIFVIGRYGDMFTRVYDFDQSGHNPLFETYAYGDQRAAAEPAKQLPPFPWVRQPKIRGTVTSLITIEKVGSGSLHRTLRVEGRKGKRRGFWEKDISARSWRFVETGRPLRRRALRNPAWDSSALRLARSEDRRYVRSGPDWTGVITNFNQYCSPAKLWIRPHDGGAPRTVVLHAIESIRQLPRTRGLDGRSRHLGGALEEGGRFTPVDVDASADEIVIRPQGWRFRFSPRSGATPGPRPSRAAPRPHP